MSSFRTMLIAAAFTLAPPAIAATAENAPKKSKSVERGPDSAWTLDLKASALAGWFDGMGVRRDSGGLAVLGGALTPVRKAGDWKVEIPLRFAHRQTFGADLPETAGAGGVSAEYRVSKALRLGGDGGVSGAWRPGWPDLYQPRADLTLAPTDRYSFVAWHLGTQLSAIPFAHNHLRLKYRYVNYAYRRDPNFQEDVDPMHLTPRDCGQHQLEGSWRYQAEAYSTTFRLEYTHREYDVALSRDAITGLTHYATDPNPLQQLDVLEPSVQVELKRLAGKMDVSVQYGYAVQDDPFQGYYSYRGHHPRLSVEYAATDRVVVRAKAEATFLEYGPNSKAAGRPAGEVGNLESGSRLYDRRGALSGSIAYEIRKGLAARVEGEWVKRDTNYPDYVPGVYPASRLYDIRWDYTNAQVLAGVEYRL